MNNVRAILAVFVVACISGVAGYSIAKRTSASVEDSRVWYAFTLQTLDFMIDVADVADPAMMKMIDEKVLLTFADSAYLLNGALGEADGVGHLRDGMCKRLPRLRSFSDLIDQSGGGVVYENGVSRDFVKDSARNLVATVSKICAE